MHKMHKLALAAAATAVVGAAAPNAYAGSNMNGPQLTGVALQSFASDRPVVTAITLRSGQTFEPRRQTTD